LSMRWMGLIQSRSLTTTFDAASPQRQALIWLLHDDYTRTTIFDDDERVIQRFALATFWFALAVRYDTLRSWLVPTSECEWGSLSCNDQSMVDALNGGYSISLGGNVPPEIALLSSLESFVGSYSDLEGTIPTHFGRLTLLTRLWLDYNSLEGPIPSEIGLMTKLTSLLIVGTGVNGTIPTEIGVLVSLRQLDLSNNDLSGPIPSEIANLANLTSFAYEENNLTLE